MAQIYITDEAKQKLDILAEAENRTQTGEIEHLLEERAKELNIELVKKAGKKK